jgi:hypothetical protein
MTPFIPEDDATLDAIVKAIGFLGEPLCHLCKGSATHAGLTMSASTAGFQFSCRSHPISLHGTGVLIPISFFRDASSGRDVRLALEISDVMSS